MEDTLSANREQKGVFITFEGGDGVGKSTHIRFLADTLRARGYEVLCLREPGGTHIGEDLRALVLDPANAEMADVAELFIYEAARAQIVSEVIAPALSRGAVVVCDRFADSTLAYQGYGRGIDLDQVRAASATACQGIAPDRTLLLQVEGNALEGLERAAADHAADRLELAGADFQTRVLAGFADIAAAEPERVRTVISYRDKTATARGVFAALSDIFTWMADPAICDDAFFASIDAPACEAEPAASAGASAEEGAR